MIDRRSFTLGIGAAAVAAAIATRAAATTALPARNVVLVHGAYADGASWSEVISRLQKVGITVTAVQNPLTSFADDVAATKRALDRQDGPTVLVGHSYAGMVISETGIDPKVTVLVYVAARAPDAGEDYPALTRTFPASPASAGLVHVGGFAQLNESAFLGDFASDVAPATARALYTVQGRSPTLCSPAARPRQRGDRNRVSTPCRNRTVRRTPIWSVSWRGE